MYGLIGKNLSHSLSKKIHNYFGNDNYELFSVDSVEEALEIEELTGFNITIPYKSQIVPHVSFLDEIAKATNSVNTVIKKRDGLYGYNTDYYGFIQTLKYNQIDIKDKNILILGNGSVSNTVRLALNNLHAKAIHRACRSKKEEQDILFSELTNKEFYDIIINTTPVGMYPNNDDDLLIDLNDFTNIALVFDLIYNPLKTKLLIEAENRNIKAINGLYMLVLQAKKAHELFFNVRIPLNKANRVYHKIKKQIINIVFIGLPLSGKSKYANLIGKELNKELIDTDLEIEKSTGSTIPDIFAEKGEAYFREIESLTVDKIYKRHSLSVSTGGGMIKNEQNIGKLRQNGVIIFLDRDPEVIAKKNIFGRPLIKTGNDIIGLAEERLPKYKSACDIIIKIQHDTKTHIEEIREKFYEYINS